MATPALSQDEVVERLRRLHAWELDGDSIRKTYRLPNYMAGLAWATTIGTIAEAHDHHPDLTIGFRSVTVRFTTHDAGNKLSAKDFAVAEAIDAIGYPKAE